MILNWHERSPGCPGPSIPTGWWGQPCDRTLDKSLVGGYASRGVRNRSVGGHPARHRSGRLEPPDPPGRRERKPLGRVRASPRGVFAARESSVTHQGRTTMSGNTQAGLSRPRSTCTARGRLPKTDESSDSLVACGDSLGVVEMWCSIRSPAGASRRWTRSGAPTTRCCTRWRATRNASAACAS